MSDINELTQGQIQDLGNKHGGIPGIKRFLSGELVLVERSALATTLVVSPQGLANGGVTYASALNVEEFLDDWAKFLWEVYRSGLPSREKIVLPKTQVGFEWGVVMPKGLLAQRILDVLKLRFDGKLRQWCQDLDKALNPEKEARTATNGPYVIWCRDRVEADEELRDFSANDLTGLGVNCMTEPERILLEGWFNWKTGGHLDVRNITLSAGSRDSDGLVPNAYWLGYYGFSVGGSSIDDRFGDVRAREVVSL